MKNAHINVTFFARLLIASTTISTIQFVPKCAHLTDDLLLHPKNEALEQNDGKEKHISKKCNLCKNGRNAENLSLFPG